MLDASREVLITCLDLQAEDVAEEQECRVAEVTQHQAARLIEKLNVDLDAALSVIAKLALENVTAGSAMDWLFMNFPEEYRERSATWLSGGFRAVVQPVASDSPLE